MVKILKIYKCKDGRVRARIKRDDGTKKVVSYPRILLEMKLGKPIDPKYDVHHIDGDYTNNSLDNLELILHGVHQKKHAEKTKKYRDKMMRCCQCQKMFLWTAKRQRLFYNDLRRGRLRYILCGRSCAAKFGMIGAWL